MEFVNPITLRLGAYKNKLGLLAVGGVTMMFSELFQNIDLPILICKNDTELSVCYGNPSVAHLLSKSEEDLLGHPLQSLLRLPHGDYQNIQELLHQEGAALEVQSSILKSSIGRVPLHLSANQFSFQGETYLKLCLDRRSNHPPSEVNSQTLILASHVAHEAPNAHESIERMLGVLGKSLKLQRLSVFEAEDFETLCMSYEWCSSEVKPHYTFWHDIPRKQLYALLMETELPEETHGVFAAGDERVIAASQSKSILSVPILFGQEAMGYLIAEDGNGMRHFTNDDSWLMEESSRLLASFIKRREQDRSLQYHLDVLNTVTNHVDGMICVHDPESREILFANRAFSELLCVPLKELRGEDSEHLMRELGKEYSKLTSEEKSLRWEFFNPRTGKWYLAKRTKIKWIDGREAQVDRMVDITEQKEHANALEHIASTDRMTGTYNREWAYRLIERLLHKVTAESPASVVFVDLDNLKCVNDSFGHSEGDRMILQTVCMIQSCIRKTDVICRWGGDEFVVIIMANEYESNRIMESVQDQVKAYNATADSPSRVSFSYGVAEIHPGTTQSVEGLIAEADQKMYDNKMQRSCNKN